MNRTKTPAAKPSKPPRARSAPPAPAADALTTYRRKRDFSKSPEPAGAKPREGKVRFFCIQKHLASHLHYDFRLEHHGVLLSWAVPKGPSPNPAIKRLAMQVEDHPREYGTFEGVIPSGYGAGIVVLWDKGVWQPLVDDVDAALARGNLPFLVLAEKVKGAWTLIRTGRVGPKAWLLIKQQDEWADEAELTERFPGSVAGPGDFAEVLARERKDPWPDGPPTKGGETGDLFRAILLRAKRLRSASAGTGRRRGKAPAGLS
jgi:bifunctional non-homologous end joining protein LigD